MWTTLGRYNPSTVHGLHETKILFTHRHAQLNFHRLQISTFGPISTVNRLTLHNAKRRHNLLENKLDMNC